MQEQSWRPSRRRHSKKSKLYRADTQERTVENQVIKTRPEAGGLRKCAGYCRSNSRSAGSAIAAIGGIKSPGFSILLIYEPAIADYKPNALLRYAL